jgi:hypothetical protein
VGVGLSCRLGVIRSSSRRPGHGLWLFIARRIAEVHGGTLSLVDSPHGADFRLELPLIEERRLSIRILKVGRNNGYRQKGASDRRAVLREPAFLRGTGGVWPTSLGVGSERDHLDSKVDEGGTGNGGTCEPW